MPAIRTKPLPTSIQASSAALVLSVLVLSGGWGAAHAASTETIKVGDQTLTVLRLDEAAANIRIDGVLDEAAWQKVAPFDEFLVLDPDTLEDTIHATAVRLLSTVKGLYVGVDMDQPPDTLVRRLSGRDQRELNRDSINLTIDTSGTGLYGYWFGINLGDALMDGTVLPERQFSNEWDGPWRGASHINETGWSAEFFIPWSMLTMPAQAGEAKRHMGIYLSRKVAYLDQRWGWPTLPPTTPRFLSDLHPIELTDVAPRQQFNFYPFTAVTVDEIDDEIRYRLGADVFWRPSSNFQVNATVNPDFGSVESDDVVINLTATETFFPEKRLFFLEGQEIFVATPRADTRSFGVGRTGLPTTLINTRRIGGRPREPLLPAGYSVTDRELIQPAELYGAAKFTGQFGAFRWGLLGAFEKDVKFDVTDALGNSTNLHTDGSDYGVARLLWENKSDGAYTALGVMSTAVLHPDADAKTHGIDWHYLSTTGKWKIDGQAFSSDLTDAQTGYGGFIDFDYTIRQGVVQGLGIEYFDEHVDINDLGFQEQQDRFRIRSRHTRTTSNLGWARNNQFDVRGFVQKNKADLFTGGGIFIGNRTTLNNLSALTLRAGFQPGKYDDLNSFGNGTYRVDPRFDTSLRWETDTGRRLSFGAEAGWQNEDLGGDHYFAQTELAWRPIDAMVLSAEVTYRDRKGWLLHQEDANFTTFNAKQWQPRLNFEYFLSARQQLRVSLQWVGIKAREADFYLIPAEPGKLIPSAKPPGATDDFAISDMVFQVRYRWEIAPLSDLFVVYAKTSDLGRRLTDQRFDDLFDDAWQNPIGDQLVVKLRYRFGN